MTTYRAHRERQHEYEREQWRNASQEERADRVRQRKEYLFAMAVVHPEWLCDLVECPNCMPGTTLPAGNWPRWFLCLSCSTVLVVDLNSHLTADGQEHVFTERLEGLGNRYTKYRWA